MTNERPPTLAIGIDAAEPRLVRSMLDAGELPTLARLLARGNWATVESPATFGSGAVWPTFMTGRPPSEHGALGEWRWRPDSMAVERWRADGLTPFWTDARRRGYRVGILDVPFAPSASPPDGFELLEWGAHDRVDHRATIGPPPAADLLRRMPQHPYASGSDDVSGPEDRIGLTAAHAEALQGARLRGEVASALIAATRPEFSVIVFSEFHHLAHVLWHGEESSPLYRGLPAAPMTNPMQTLMAEIDHQVAAIQAALGEEGNIVVFSLHGMRPTRGLPMFLPSILSRLGFATRPSWTSRSWNERGRHLLRQVKQQSPAALKRAYHRRAGPSLQSRLAATTMLEEQDWSRTVAFALPSDQHGWIRLNLVGRERLGIVEPRRYETVCREVAEALAAVAGPDGRPLVEEVVPTLDGGDSRTHPLPDLVVHWSSVAHEPDLDLGPGVPCLDAASRRLTGQHDRLGFCIANGPHLRELPDRVRTEDLPALLMEAVGA